MTALFAVYDAMQFLGPPIHTRASARRLGGGRAAGGGRPGHRSALPNARILIHQPHGGAQGQSADMEIQVREMVTMRERMVDILTERTNQTRERIEADIDRDYILRERGRGGLRARRRGHRHRRKPCRLRPRPARLPEVGGPRSRTGGRPARRAGG